MEEIKLEISEINKLYGVEDDVDYLYHYTTVDALVNGIVVKNPKKGEELCLWATNSQYMNDPEELKEGIRILSTFYSELNKLLNENKFNINQMEDNLELYKQFYLTSLSKNRDSLPMWNMYGANGHGIALKFTSKMQQVDCDDYIVKCEYDASKLINNLQEKFDRNNKNKSAMLLFLIPLVLKNSAYSYENEVRIASRYSELITKYRCRNGLVIPYKEIFLEKELLEGIIIGPAANREEVKISLRRFLDDNNLQNVKIEFSDVPYRS